MLQQDTPKDYVISTGKQISVRDFLKKAFEILEIEVKFSGTNENEIATVVNFNSEITPELKLGQVIMKIDPRYYRPSEVENLLGDSSLAAKELGWTAKISIAELCEEMINEDLKNAYSEYQVKLINSTL
jgi:GDPmannose 4,6-dehydratase